MNSEILRKKIYRFLDRHRWDARTWLVCGAVIWLLSAALCSCTTREELGLTPEPTPMIVYIDREVPVLRDPTPSDEVSEEAEEIARVLYGMRVNSREDLWDVCWVIINRVEDTRNGYASTISEICRQRGQWVGYSEDNPIVDELYEIALEAVDTWHDGGHRPFSGDYLWFDWSPSEVAVKKKF